MSIVVAHEFRCDRTLSEILEALRTGALTSSYD